MYVCVCSSDSTGSPTDLLKTRGLSDGNFISAKFVTVTHVHDTDSNMHIHVNVHVHHNTYLLNSVGSELNKGVYISLNETAVLHSS